MSSSGGGGGIGSSIAYSPPSGTITPVIPGFTHSVGRIEITLSADTTFNNLPTGADGQQLFLNIVAGNFLLTLPKTGFFASGNFVYGLNDTAQLYYDIGLSEWVIVA